MRLANRERERERVNSRIQNSQKPVPKQTSFDQKSATKEIETTIEKKLLEIFNDYKDNYIGVFDEGKNSTVAFQISDIIKTGYKGSISDLIKILSKEKTDAKQKPIFTKEEVETIANLTIKDSIYGISSKILAEKDLTFKEALNKISARIIGTEELKMYHDKEFFDFAQKILQHKANFENPRIISGRPASAGLILESMDFIDTSMTYLANGNFLGTDTTDKILFAAPLLAINGKIKKFLNDSMRGKEKAPEKEALQKLLLEISQNVIDLVSNDKNTTFPIDGRTRIELLENFNKTGKKIVDLF